jgi:hypothetical protein
VNSDPFQGVLKVCLQTYAVEHRSSLKKGLRYSDLFLLMGYPFFLFKGKENLKLIDLFYAVHILQLYPYAHLFV